jgi:hypothetical protein
VLATLNKPCPNLETAIHQLLTFSPEYDKAMHCLRAEINNINQGDEALVLIMKIISIFREYFDMEDYITHGIANYMSSSVFHIDIEKKTPPEVAVISIKMLR